MQLKKMSKKRLAVSVLSSALILQATFYNTAFASTIVDGSGNAINKTEGTGAFDIRPEAYKGDIGFRKLQQLLLDKGDVANFIFNYLKENASADGQNHEHFYQDISKFVTLVDGKVTINGIVNALNQVGGDLKSNGHLIFVTPQGMVVGSSGVLNVGSLSVYTPDSTSYNALKNGIPSATKYDEFVNQPLAVEASADFNNWQTNTYNRGSGVIQIDGGVAARGDVLLDGGTVNIGNTGMVFGGVNDETTIRVKEYTGMDGETPIYNTYDPEAQAKTLFDSLVNNRLTSGNALAGSGKDIVIKAGNGVTVADGGMLVNNSASNGLIDITNYGSNGININGEVRNNSAVNGTVNITNKAGQLNVGSTGLVTQVNGDMTFLNDGDSLNIAEAGQVINTGTLAMTNNGANGFNTSGSITNTGNTTLTNTGSKGFNLESTGRITNNGSSLTINNNGADGANFKGITKTTNGGTIDVNNQNSNVTIGDTSSNDYYFDSTGNVTFTVSNGNILNNNVAKTHVRTVNGKNLVMNVTNGRIGDEVGPCKDGVCTGIGTDARDWTKSINTNIDGTITATSTEGSNTSLINIGSANKDMHVNHIGADGRVILLADDINSKNGSDYDILNYAETAAKPNVEGAGISMIASRNIGTTDKALTFRQNGVKEVFDGDDARDPHVFQKNTDLEYGVDMLADNNIYVKGLDADDGTKVDTNVCAMIARKGDINAEFSGDTYIDQTTAQNNINITTRGKNLVIDNLGLVPDYPKDYYGPNGDIVPEKVTLKALDLGTRWADDPDYRYAADSTIVVKNGKINGTTKGRPNTQDLELVADNAYAGGYYFNMGKHRGQNENGKFNLSTVTPDDSTNAIKNSDGENISIRGKAVRPDDVKGIGQDPDDRNYYYGGSSQGDDPNYDKDGDIMDDGDKGGENDDDNLVVPTPEPTTPEPTTPEPTTPEPTTPEPTTPEPTTPEPTTPEPTTPEPTTPEPTTPEPTTPEPTTPEPTTPEPTTPEPTTPEPTTPEPTTPEPTTPEPTTPEPTTPEPTTPEPTTPEPTTPEPTTPEPTTPEPTTPEPTTPEPTTPEPTTPEPTTPEPTTPEPTPEPTTPNVWDETWIQRKDITDSVPTIDKRQYIRFDSRYTENPVQLLGDSSGLVNDVLDISRGGCSLAHDNSLKVGDVVPVHIQYGDIDIQTDVKIVTATDKRAGAEFVNIDSATANRLLFLSLLLDSEPGVREQIQASFGNNLSSINQDF